jgi:O-antigen/teichoic acid export membrane protein
MGVAWVALAWLLRGPVVVLLGFPEASRSDAAFVVLAAAVVFAIMGVALVTMAVAQGYGRFDLANRAMLTLSAQHAIGIPIVLANGWGLRGLIINAGLGWLTGWLVARVSVRRALPQFIWSTPAAALPRVREAMRFGGPMQVAVAAFALHMHMDKFLLVPLDRLAAVTPYEIGFRVSNAALSLVQLLLLAVLPVAAALHSSRETERLERLYRHGSRYVLTAIVLLFVPLTVGADRLLALWLGESHPETAIALRGLALASALLALTGMGTSVVRGIGRTDVEASFALLVVTLHAALALWWIPIHGLRGAVVAAVVATAAGTLYFLVRLARLVSWDRWSTLVAPHLPPLLAAGAATAAGVAADRVLPEGLSPVWGLAIVAGGAGGAALLVLFGSGYLRWRELRDAALPPGTR